MKLYIKSSEDITNEYLNDLFKNIDWDDVDYADRMINRIIKKHLGVDDPIDQAKYINMLDDDVKSELMNLLKDPEALHNKRLSGRRKSSKGKSTELKVIFEDYPDGKVKTEVFEGSSRIEALKNMADSLLLYIDGTTIDDDNMSESDILNYIESRNGDGCDYIIELTDTTTGETLLDAPYDYTGYDD